VNTLFFRWPRPASLDSTSMPPASRARGAFRRRSPGALTGTRSGAPLPLADGGRNCTFSSRFETSTRPFSAPLSRASHGRVRFNDFCRSMFQRARRWAARASSPRKQQGWPSFAERSLPFDRRWRPPKVLRVRGRSSPSLDLPSRDCSRERLCPDPDRFRHLVSRHSLSPCLESTWVTGEAAGAASASKARAAGGRCAAGFPRRNSASSRPRCLPS